MAVSPIIGTEEVEIGKNAAISGDVMSGGEVKIQQGDKDLSGLIDGSIEAFGDVRIERYNHITGDVTLGGRLELPKEKHANTVVIDGTIAAGAVVDPVGLPPVYLKVDPENAPDVKVKKKEDVDLQPNDSGNPAYGKLKADQQSTVTLHSGTYYFERFELHQDAELVIEIANGTPITINIKDGLTMGHHSKVTIDGGDASDVLFNLSGLGISNPEEDGKKGKSDKDDAPKLASRIDHHAQFAGTIYSPQGKLELAHHSVMEGALIGRQVDIADEAQFTANPAGHLDLSFNPFIVAKRPTGRLVTGAPANFVLLPNFPNPFNQQTTIRFSLPDATRARLEIFDILGQKVRTLVDGELPAGYHSVNWNGQDEAGQPVSSGVYLLRLQAGKLREVRRMLLLK